mgnify:CR=1 FL=1
MSAECSQKQNALQIRTWHARGERVATAAIRVNHAAAQLERLTWDEGCELRRREESEL